MPTSVLSLFPLCFSYQWVVLDVPVPVLFVAGWVVLDPRSPRKLSSLATWPFSCFIRLMNSFLQAARQLTRWGILPLYSIFDWDSTYVQGMGTYCCFTGPRLPQEGNPYLVCDRYLLLHQVTGILLTFFLYNSYNCGGMRKSLALFFFCPSTF